MSEQLPKFKRGDKVQILQSDGMVNLGVACLTGEVIAVIGYDYYDVKCDDGKIRRVNACVLNHNCHNHKFVKGLTPQDVGYKISPYSGNIENAKRICFEVNNEPNPTSTNS